MIAHIDADAFFAAVLVRQHPELRGKPLLALGMGGGCVISASYEAKAKGVKTGMRLSEALKLAPDALRLNSDFRETGLASEQIERILRSQCPLVEQMSVDEWFLHLPTLVGGMPADLAGWATRTRQMVLDYTAISTSVGVGPSKLLAKMASEYRKPAGVTVVTMGTLEAFLRDRSAAAIPGIGHRRVLHTEAEGWHTAWDIAMAPSQRLLTLFGRPGIDMQRELLGDPVHALVAEPAPPKSLSRCRSFRREQNPRLLWAHLLRHAQYLVLKLRRHELAANGISVWLRDDQYRHDSTHASLPQPTTTEEALQPYLRRSLRHLFQSRMAYTQVGLALWRLTPRGPMQFMLFDDTRNLCRAEDLQHALDQIHQRFGRNALSRGAAMAVKSGTRMGLELSIYE